MEKLVYKFLDSQIGREFKFRNTKNNSGRCYILPSNQTDLSGYLFRVYTYEGSVSRVDVNPSTINTISSLFSIGDVTSKHYVGKWFKSIYNIVQYDDFLKFNYE
jgi:hypothetical protein